MNQLTIAQMQASEPEPRVLKRQRSQPSNWWAAKPLNSPGPSTSTSTARVEVAEAALGAREGDAGVGMGTSGEKKKRAQSQPHVLEEGGNSLKRQRNRPSEWWAANTSTASPVASPALVVKKRVRRSGGGIQEVFGAGNRGRMGRDEGEDGDAALSKAKNGKGKVEVVLEGGSVGAEKEKPARRLRSSAGEAELQLLGGSSGDIATVRKEGKGKKRGKSAVARVQEDAMGNEGPKKRGRPSTGRSEEQADELLGEQTSIPRKRGRPSTGAIEKAVQHGNEGEVSKKRTRRSTARVEDQDDELVAGASGGVRPQSRRGEPSAAPTEKEAEGQPKPVKKHGRPSLSTKVEADKPSPDQGDSKRGRPTGMGKSTEIAPEESEPRNARIRRQPGADFLEQNSASTNNEATPARGRPRKRQSDMDEQARSLPEEQERGRRRTRQSDVQAEAEAAIEERGRRKTRKAEVESQQVVSEPVVARSSKPTRSSRRSEIVEVETATSKLTKNRGEKRSKTSRNPVPVPRKDSSTQASSKTKATQSSNTTSSAPPQTQKKAARRPSQVKATHKKRNGDDDAQSVPSKRQRVEKVPEPARIEEPAVDSLGYQHLEAVQKLVSRRTVESKWEALPPTAVDRIAQLLGDLQHPVIARLKDERKKTQASTALETASRKLIHKLSQGLPFPPGTRSHREDDFDFEKILDHNRALEAQLTPALHSNELLEAELSKERARLESDLEILAELEKNAKTEAVVRNKAARKLHSVLQTESSTAETHALRDNIGLIADQPSQTLDLGVEDDEDLNALVNQLDGHVDSIRGNIKQVEGVSQAILKSRAAVQATLFEHLDIAHYDDVVLGAG
ncbi:hypothetical protein VTL71DRAFT_12707 [Oculimacula yallundae]|uniref:Kinetochore protein fta7 n=1 Tax=Oculimacula yallundae TaxID=86028 RepID=A0ABR4CP00_9HELO